MATVPLRVSNRLGFGMLQVQNVDETSITGTTLFKFNNHPQRNINFFGGFFVKVPQNLSELTSQSNEVAFVTIDSNETPTKLYLYDGTVAKISDIGTTGGGIMLCFYDRMDGKLQLVNAF